MRRLIRALVDYGANLRIALALERYEYETCGTVLDIVRKKLVEMRSWSKDDEPRGFSQFGPGNSHEKRVQRKANALL